MILNQTRGAVEFASHLPRYREIVSILWKYGFAERRRLARSISPCSIRLIRKDSNRYARHLTRSRTGSTNAILTASVLICSSILVLAGLPPKLGGVPILGMAGLIWGTHMCLRLVLSIWKHGGL